ncbi:hypothetical protein [Bradyrhizobium hereditatis]|uniref:hypothetical protein n=1 Tax=Bradyrhizobium hereditatis TaxID=2821405 RepID=UPI001CE2A55D|nr:hypothetical protein [Bradyrhizobium hereditatis]
MIELSLYAGTMAMVSSTDFASVRKADRDFNIKPPASPYAIMLEGLTYRGENSGLAQG